MAITLPRSIRRQRASHWLIGLTAVAAVVAVLPIVAALLGALPGSVAPASGTAFASAPTGTYAVALRGGDVSDAVVVFSVDDPGEAIEVASIPHIRGHVSRGAALPGGRLLALVVADGGTPSSPVASLAVLDLETGSLAKLAAQIDALQVPTWSADGSTIAFTRTAEPQAEVFTVSPNGGEERLVLSLDSALGAFPVAFDAGGRLLTVVIDPAGSALWLGAAPFSHLSSQITRDWRLSPDGTQLAFIESATSGGLQYLPRVVRLAGGGGVASASAPVPDAGQRLGVAWAPNAAEATYGAEPRTAVGGVSAQGAAPAGFDVPLAYSPDGAALAVQHWTGSSFAAPGELEYQLVAGDRRITLDRVARFVGWASR